MGEPTNPMMNASKAREYFSAFYEGSLDRGLRESFERVLRADAQIQAEYRAFSRTMDQLNGMSEVDVEIPSDLHDRIIAKLDLNAWEQKQRQRPSVFSWWKTALVATAVIAVAAFGVIRAGQGVADPTIEANPIPSMSPRARLDVKPIGDGVLLNYPKVNQRDVIIRDEHGTEKERIQLVNQGIEDKRLSNDGLSATIVEIVINDSHTYIALPPIEPSMTPARGSGDVRQLALDIANQCRVPVIVQGPLNELAGWTIDSSDAHGSAQEALKDHGYKVELRGDRSEPRMLWILEN